MCFFKRSDEETLGKKAHLGTVWFFTVDKTSETIIVIKIE